MADQHDVETTGHQWDSEEGYPLKEFNNPLPRWWLYSFYATVIWAVVYWVLYPAWPMLDGYTKGMLGWSMHQEFAQDSKAALAQKKASNDRLEKLSLKEIARDNSLLQHAMSGGKAIFGDFCAPCHGSGGVGVKAGGFPTLADDDWLFGGDLDTIYETIDKGRDGAMPAHLQGAGGAFSEAQVNDLTEYVLSLSKRSQDAAAAQRGDQLFHGEAGCNGCHGDLGNGSIKGTVAGSPAPPVGAPNLTDAVWLYGSDPAVVRASIAKGRTGHMPAWGSGAKETGKRLTPLQIKQLALYVHGLGGGQ
ncbi:MAG: cytochrome-c oxidase, cbb3-type subunit III [Magnetococcales bacterium]|nr:cytochrome-c oxidase, cbb3-type subunit III [Magnetococcales bacterium]